MGISIGVVTGMLLPFFIPALLSVRILNKAGYSRWWALLFIVPFINVIMVWVFAYAKWPALIGENTQG
jgi:uncharacterized membrane protein YhaH (DUF805 family)